MATVNDELVVGKDRPHTLYDEADKLLRFAEGLLEKCEQHHHQRTSIVIVALGMIGAVWVSLIYLLCGASLEKSSFTWIIATVLPSFTAVILTFLVSRYITLGGYLARDQHAYHGIVDILRGIQLGIVERDKLSTLEQVEFRIRLSRFDIGPGSPISATGPRHPVR